VDPLTEAFKDRLQEIDAYLDLLDALEGQVRTGPPKIGDSPITAQQQKILYSSVYLQLYNLVEATITNCIDAVVAAACNGGRWRPGDLAPQLRREWVRAAAHTHADLNYENRLKTAVVLCDRLIQAVPIWAWAVEAGGGGNWDDHQIEDITERLGFDLGIDPATLTAIKRKVRDDKRPLELVKELRNRLAHGSLSFAECGDGVTVPDLRDIRNRTAQYLQEVLGAFRKFIDSYEFLIPASRPATGTGS
jgi:HEPN superfamily protein